jgi:putative hydrolase of the HAD superfamily
MIAAVLFDLYETLVTERQTTPVRASSLGERLGLDGAAFRDAWKRQRSRVIHGDVSFPDALVEIGSGLGRTVDSATIRSVCEARRREKAMLFEQVDPDALAAIRELHGQGVKLAVVSNCFAEDVHGWAQCVASPWFDASVFSFDVGAAKPEPQIYLEATRRLRVEPAEALFVGDGGDDELAGAERAGLGAAQAAWFRGPLAGLPAHVPRLSSWQAVVALVAAGREPRA